jgi:hypothetical protein
MTKDLWLNFMVGARDLSFLHNMQISFGVHLATCPMVMSMDILTLEIGRSCNQDLFWQEQEFFFFTVSDRLWGPPTVQANSHWTFFHKG